MSTYACWRSARAAIAAMLGGARACARWCTQCVTAARLAAPSSHHSEPNTHATNNTVLRNLDEYILIGVETIKGYGTAREFSSLDDDGHHMVLKVRQRGGGDKEIVLVIPSHEISADFKHWVSLLPPVD